MDRQEALDTALGQIERQFGKGSVMRMSDRAAVSVGAVSTGSLSLDLALGIGGLPRGRIIEIFGPESSGKTTLVYHVIAEAQRRGNPPMPSARSSASEPVETAPTETAARSFIFMTDPLPNCRSIWPSATSSASCLSTSQPPKATDSKTSYRAPPGCSRDR